MNTELVDPLDGADAPLSGGSPVSGGHRSLVDDVEDLVQDARIYFDAELSYHKTRASFVAASLKRTAAFGAIAGVLALFAFGALTVGLIIALTPSLTAWGATGAVVGVLVLIAAFLVRGAIKSASDMLEAIRGESADGEEDAASAGTDEEEEG